MIAVFALAGAIVALDQFAKVLVLDRLPLGVPIALIDDLLSLTLVMNPGLGAERSVSRRRASSATPTVMAESATLKAGQ